MLKSMMVLAAAAVLGSGSVASAGAPELPSTFETRTVEVPGARIHVAWGGSGPPVVLLHGYTQTGDMWGPLAEVLARDHTVVVPDLRGIGRSSRPEGGYDKRTQAGDVHAVLEAIGVGRRPVALVGHDIGNMVAYAYAARYRDGVSTLVLMDAPLPGIDPWDELIRDRALWHFSFGGPDAERLVAGRERIYLDRFWNEFAADPAKLDEATRNHYATLYAQPGAMRAGFAQFAAFEQDARDNQAFLRAGKLTIPVLAIGGEKSMGPTMAAQARNAADDVRQVVIPGSGHWLMEEQPTATIAAVRTFLSERNAAR